MLHLRLLSHVVDRLVLCLKTLYPEGKELEEAEKKSLAKKRQRFTFMVGILIVYAWSRGYTLTMGEGFVASGTGHIDNSLHYSGLAIDMNLFQEGEYLKKTEDHSELGAFWESIGGTWGGRFKDGNHYSLANGGVR